MSNKSPRSLLFNSFFLLGREIVRDVQQNSNFFGPFPLDRSGDASSQSCKALLGSEIIGRDHQTTHLDRRELGHIFDFPDFDTLRVLVHARPLLVKVDDACEIGACDVRKRQDLVVLIDIFEKVFQRRAFAPYYLVDLVGMPIACHKLDQHIEIRIEMNKKFLNSVFCYKKIITWRRGA